jgi:hypothetical protein
MAHVKYYRTSLEGKEEDRYEILANLMAVDAELREDLKPRILSLVDRKSGDHNYLSAIVVWE